jgi:hypothetical protein
MSREDRLAELIAEGQPLFVARELMGLTKGQAAGIWERIKRKLGPQAS